MPKANYCRKCKAEVPVGEACPHCGGKLAQTGERISFDVTVTPVRDWFAWNGLLRLCLLPLALVMLAALAAELLSGGMHGMLSLLSGGFIRAVLTALVFMLLAILALLALQGREHVHYVLDRDGVHALCYLVEPRAWQLYARFVTPAMVNVLNEGGDEPDGLTLVRKTFLPWAEVRRLRFWREDVTLLFFCPTFWMTIAIRFPPEDFAQAEAYARKKLKRFKRASVPPEEKNT